MKIGFAAEGISATEPVVDEAKVAASLVAAAAPVADVSAVHLQQYQYKEQ